MDVYNPVQPAAQDGSVPRIRYVKVLSDCLAHLEPVTTQDQVQAGLSSTQTTARGFLNLEFQSLVRSGTVLVETQSGIAYRVMGDPAVYDAGGPGDHLELDLERLVINPVEG
jgi:hypothetical protein